MNTARNTTWAAPLAAILCATASASAGAVQPGPYTLTDANFSQGCLPPCFCFAVFLGDVSGTMTIGEAQPGDAFDFYPITDIEWEIALFGNIEDTITATGVGVYQVSNTGEPAMEALALTLTFEGPLLDGQTIDFFSPLQETDGTPGFDIDIVEANKLCLVNSFGISAQPSDFSSPVKYQVGAGSTYQEGCHEPCDCPLEAPRAMRGTWDLTELGTQGNVTEYAVDNINLTVRRATPDGQEMKITGSGTYTVIQSFAGTSHEMELALSVDGNEIIIFDQELENARTAFPDIDISVDLFDLVCYDVVLTFNASPSP